MGKGSEKCFARHAFVCEIELVGEKEHAFRLAFPAEAACRLQVAFPLDIRLDSNLTTMDFPSTRNFPALKDSHAE
jgi:hypothetical protein